MATSISRKPQDNILYLNDMFVLLPALALPGWMSLVAQPLCAHRVSSTKSMAVSWLMAAWHPAEKLRGLSLPISELVGWSQLNTSQWLPHKHHANRPLMEQHCTRAPQ